MGAEEGADPRRGHGSLRGPRRSAAGRPLSPTAIEVLTPARLASLPAPLLRRQEVQILDFAARRAHRQTLDPRRREAYLATLALNAARLDRLGPILAEARARGLRLVVLKGLALAPTVYGDAGARPMVDVDLLCAPSELSTARALFELHGFVAEDVPDARARLHATHDIKLQAGPVYVELHHRLWHELGIGSDASGLVMRAVEADLDGHRALVPATADHLFVVLVHAALHGFAGNPLWITDAALLAAAAGPSVWPEVHARAAEQRAELPLLAALDHLALLFPELVPPRSRRAPLRRALLRRLAPWLQRGEPELGLLPSRIVRPLLVDDARTLAAWSLTKLRLRGTPD